MADGHPPGPGPAVTAAGDITGLVLAGGRGSRMGGIDKGLQLFRGVPLAQHALRRLGAQAGTTAINANRNIDRYEAMGAPVWPDALPPGTAGGLSGGPGALRNTLPADGALRLAAFPRRPRHAPRASPRRATG